ncbi:MAG: AMP-binding protein [Blautia marasmi]
MTENFFTWRELANLSRQMGTAFAQKMEHGKPIIIFLEKSAVTLAAMFGAVYAGCFYVVVDPSQPIQRIQGILNVLEPGLIVANDKTGELLVQMDYKGNTCQLNDAMKEPADRQMLQKIRKESQDTDILYGIFTSGSTGTPKGIIVSHRAAIDFITHFVRTFRFTVHDRIGNQAPFDFDVSVKDIYTSMFTGAELVIIPKEMFSTPPVLLDYLCKKEVTALIWAVSALSLVAALKGLDYKVPLSVKKFFSAVKLCR